MESEKPVAGLLNDYKATGTKPIEVKKATQDNDQQKKNRRKIRARSGRPPRKQDGSRPNRAKMTVYVDIDLADLYRLQSWKQMCNLGELIEKALAAYRESQRWDEKPGT